MCALDKTVSGYVYSSRIYRDTDDSVKDEDNVSWVMKLGEQEKKDWITVIRWIRIADRILERDRLQKQPLKNSDSYSFKTFMRDWRRLRLHGQVEVNSKFGFLFKDLKDLWYRENLSESDLREWDLYLYSISHYIKPRLVIQTMKDYENALYGMSGTFFQAFPYKPKNCNEAIGALGILDQFYNNLRDMYEDTKRGIIYFPTVLMKEFDIKRSEMLTLVTKPNSRYEQMMEHLLVSFVPEIRKKCLPLVSNSLHYSWKRMLENVLLRHSRTEYVSRLCNFNAKEFSKIYWNYYNGKLDCSTNRCQEILRWRKNES